MPTVGLASEPFVNDITLPSKHYMMEGVENRLYSQTFLKRWRPYNDFVRYGGSVEYPKGGRLEQGAMIDNPKDGDDLEITLINGDYFDTLAHSKAIIRAATPGVGDKETVVQFLGDSFTQGIYFKHAFIESGYVPNVKLVGIRIVADYPEYNHEGRGGWKLDTYFKCRPNNEFAYNPYYQPLGEYRYWGSVEFWRNVRYVKEEKPSGPFELTYHCSNYNNERFGEDGYLLSPKSGDVMYSVADGCYIEWSRGKWREIKTLDSWDFDYAKYLDMWELESPEFLVVMLGLNDFRDLDLPLDFTLWNERMERLLVSYRAAVPEGRLILATPCSSCGSLNNERGDFTTRQNALMWEHRRNIIEVFDGREDEGIYVVDASITTDNEGGYNIKDGIQSGNPHPYPGYPQLGVPIAAFVQYYREK
ncbi:MAG: SGNH/GDSL hydrolase family protein [Rikenellaceae bacterium]